ncbi:GNAT family N-acetyltransferase [Pseudomonas plecoglossicida]|uniref:GNAT family N-acetyltransferase n=1 Tax=Pseudomonas putida group TaxID=136845 RepID=UPI00240F7381|nr:MULTISPECIES: GNAT family N-acetyltransferase [Pseudomonas putida group]MDQ7965510.1 GNAT family N-acetyltransferase [Pseudomonas plecoglossicida]WFG03775.1 GNAT family N-acetyltransferase [Pseudomonas putida]
MIRPATHDDIPRLVELGAIMHSTTSYSHLDYLPEKVGRFLGQLIDGLGVMFVAEVDGVLVGGLAGAVTEQWFNDDLVAYEYCVFVEPSKRQGLLAMKMVLAFQEWSKIKGAKEIHMGVTTDVNVDGTTRLYSRLGFKYAGPVMKMEI